jgi:hypothetical protein
MHCVGDCHVGWTFKVMWLKWCKSGICRSGCDAACLDFIVDHDGILRVRRWVFVCSVGGHRVISFLGLELISSP